ncbi:MAG TPA: DNA recombination protein RmuC [Bacteroidia bacterium]|nr:DNA recombination protein RmuC [Bacteroidia bacterium]HNT79961.1 DNA recombination protein RmuC [Bacteroidia bacterium]
MEWMYITIIVLLFIVAVFLYVKTKSYDQYLAPEEQMQMKLEQQSMQQQLVLIEEQKNALTNELKFERERIIKTTGELHASLTQSDLLTKMLEEQKKELSAMQEQMTLQFKNLANKILEENSSKFTLQNKENLSQILSPFKDRIKEFEEKVQHHYDSENREKASLKQQISMLHDLNQKMSVEAQNLTKALKGDNKTQGSWGEFILESVLEKSGLVRDREYLVQESYTGSDGKRLQPDVVIALPDEKNLVIDSKMSLVAYERFVNSVDENEKLRAAKEHMNSIRAHIKSLSEKNYQQIYQLKSLDFVLLFVPIESAFALGVQNDSQLFNDAFERNIVIVSPSTLLATLRTVASIWRQEKQNKNAAEISRLAGQMYDKLVNFTDDMNKIQKHIQEADKAYGLAMKKLSEGHGNAVITAQKIKALGANASKQIGEEWIRDEFSSLEEA